jgi:hypothetical protein
MAQLFDTALRLREILISHATGGIADAAEYGKLRRELLLDPDIRGLVPEFVRSCRDPDQFWDFIKSKFPNYAARRIFIRNEFETLLDVLESSILDGEPVSANEKQQAVVKSDATTYAPKVFLSYQTSDKNVAGEVKRILEKAGIETFLAHEDIEVSHQWQRRILEELNQAKIFVCLLSANYTSSVFCLQESGIAISRSNITIIPLTIDGKTVSPGFMAHIQSAKINPDAISLRELAPGLSAANPDLAIAAFIKTIASSSNYRTAEMNFQMIAPYIVGLRDEQAAQLIEICANNGQVHDAALCARVHIPQLLKSHPDAGAAEDREFLVRTCKRYGGTV